MKPPCFRASAPARASRAAAATAGSSLASLASSARRDRRRVVGVVQEEREEEAAVGLHVPPREPQHRDVVVGREMREH